VSAAGRASARCELEQALGAGGAERWLGMGATQVLVARSAKKQAEQSRPKRRAVQTQKLWAGTGDVWVRRQNKAVAGGGAAGTGSSAGVSSATQEQLERRWSTEAALGDGAGFGRRRAARDWQRRNSQRQTRALRGRAGGVEQTREQHTSQAALERTSRHGSARAEEDRCGSVRAEDGRCNQDVTRVENARGSGMRGNDTAKPEQAWVR
jgi:hypothetical protein